MNVTSPSSGEGRPGTPPRSARRSSAARSSASSRSPRSEARASASGASRPRPGCRPRTRSTTPARRSRSSASASPSRSSTSPRPRPGRTASSTQMTGGVAGLFKANGVEWVRGTGRFTSATTIAVEGAEDVTFRSAIVATGSYPMRPPIPGLDSPRCVDSTGLLSQTEVPAPARRARRRDHRLRVRVDLRALRQRGDDRRDAADADPAGGRRRGEGAEEGVQEARASRCTSRSSAPGSRTRAIELVVHFGDGESVEADLMLVAVGRAPLVQGLGLDEIGVPTDPRSGIATDDHMRTAIPTIFAAGDVAGRWQLAHTAFREGEIAAENAMGHEVGARHPVGAAPDLHRSRDRRCRAHRGAGPRALRRRRRGRSLPVGRERPSRHVGSDRRAG